MVRSRRSLGWSRVVRLPCDLGGPAETVIHGLRLGAVVHRGRTGVGSQHRVVEFSIDVEHCVVALGYHVDNPFQLGFQFGCAGRGRPRWVGGSRLGRGRVSLWYRTLPPLVSVASVVVGQVCRRWPEGRPPPAAPQPALSSTWPVFPASAKYLISWFIINSWPVVVGGLDLKLSPGKGRRVSIGMAL